MAHIHGMHANSSILQQAIGETAGRRANIQADPAGGIDLEAVEGGLQFETPAAYESRAREYF
jgi:hypothetical protein